MLVDVFLSEINFVMSEVNRSSERRRSESAEERTQTCLRSSFRFTHAVRIERLYASGSDSASPYSRCISGAAFRTHDLTSSFHGSLPTQSHAARGAKLC